MEESSLFFQLYMDTAYVRENHGKAHPPKLPWMDSWHMQCKKAPKTKQAMRGWEAHSWGVGSRDQLFVYTIRRLYIIYLYNLYIIYYCIVYIYLAILCHLFGMVN